MTTPRNVHSGGQIIMQDYSRQNRSAHAGLARLALLACDRCALQRLGKTETRIYKHAHSRELE